MNSKIFKLNASDFVKGLIVAIITAALTAAYTALNSGAGINWKEVGIVSITAGIGYLLKNFASNSDGQPLSKENK